MKYKLFIPSFGDTVEDAYQIESIWPDDAVLEYCKHLHDENDGWEWMRNDGCQTKICVVDENEKVSYYCFELEYEPSFIVAEVPAG